MRNYNVTEKELRNYIEVFHSTLQETAQDYLPSEYWQKLIHLSLLPAHIIGYLSTQYGVGFEYHPSKQTTIEVKRGSSTVEELFVQAPSNLRNTGPMLRLNNCINCGIFRITLDGAFPFRLAGTHTSLSIGDVRFKIGLWYRDVQYAELYGNRLQDNWSTEKAISRAKNEVLAALVEINRASKKDIPLEQYISKHKEKTVLLLGSYDSRGEQRLESISVCLRKLGYEPVLVKDVPDHPQQSLEQKVVVLGAISRFVVVDDSEKSGHIAEIEICKNNYWTTILLRAHGIGSSWMTAGSSIFSNTILEKNYNPDSPQEALLESVAWAEQKLKEVQARLSKIYPWR